jgi:hypothetical protein
MAKHRRSGPKQKLPKAAETIGFTATDEAFFDAGESLPETHVTAHEEEVRRRRRPSFWRRLFSTA